MNPHIVDLRKRAALLRAQAHELEEQAKALEAAGRPPREGDHYIVPQAGTLGLDTE